METFFSVCPLSGWHAREGGSSRTHEFESTHGKKLEEPISHIFVWFNGRILILVARS